MILTKRQINCLKGLNRKIERMRRRVLAGSKSQDNSKAKKSGQHQFAGTQQLLTQALDKAGQPK